MDYANVKFAGNAREKIIEGVNLITDAIQCTYGPDGKQVAIKLPSGVKLTKDGATVASAVNDDDPYIQMGIELIREVSRKTADDVGDGSSTVAILARAFISSCLNYTRYSLNTLPKIIEEIKENLSSHSISVNTLEDLQHIASVSANNNTEIGNIIAEAFNTVGKDGIVNFEQSDEVADRIEYSKGFRIENGYSSPYFINTSKGTCELTNVLVHISDTKLNEVKDVINLADAAMKQRKSLLLIAPGFDSEIYIFLKANLDKLQSCTVISPNFRNYRQILTDDIRDIIGESKTCENIICDSQYTTFIGYQSNTDNINKKIEEAREISINGANQFDRDFNKKRLANFTSGIATILVGGYSPTEISSKMDLYEDAVNATHQAMIHGYLPGGGTALRDYGLTREVCGIASQSFFDVLKLPSTLLNTLDKTPEDMINSGVIEPTTVALATLENAFSIAMQIISCDCAILNDKLMY